MYEPTKPSGPAPADLWSLPIQYAKGVGPKRAALLARLGVATVEEALWYAPRRYEDRSSLLPIGQLVPGVAATVCGTVIRARLSRIPRRRMSILNVTIEDDTGALQCVYFNQPYLEDVFKTGCRVMVSGTALAGRKGWTDLRMDVPHYEVLDDEDEPLHVGRIVPVYPETKGITSRQLRTLIKGLLDHYLDGMADIVPAQVRFRQRLLPIRAALREVHFPQSPGDLEALNQGVTPAHRRLAFEEFLLLQLGLASQQQAVKEEAKGVRFDMGTPLVGKLRALLPFRLTQAQERVLAEIQHDMASPRPMHRLIQGDVGCGKTVVALLAMVTACGSGCQAALMVPTEILAEQHYLNMRRLLEGLGLTAVLLTGGGTPKARAAVRKQIETGEAHVAIGTHALIQKHVQFARLGLVVIDEQHKFGVLQRKTLLAKGYRPDVLVLTATPIPRTLAMTVYGDLDVSAIDALPPGRKPVRTRVFDEPERRRAYQFVQDEVRAGRQAYVVYPLVEESEKVDLRAAIEGAERLQQSIFKSVRVGLLHGRMKGEEKERTMAAFKSGELQVLVATTVIEVGVDVPNASVMVIEHAERFGLAQLHQLRGRVGRGAQQSYCLLLSAVAAGVEGSAARRRLDALVASNDGFVIAEEDLRLRGPGEFFGARQWGVPEFRVANLIRDGALLEQARLEAQAMVREDPRLSASDHQAARDAMRRRWQAKLVLGSVS
ncbi:MAG: ATP-dependent DNA helicase RecG [Nitrospirae bacterium RIFCSPLOWO2_01_FULL_62_17]|nr:MAG: ATP-dependent DNA helicase RecG [Nitrospirae bacterium RIFCSPLOWO2_01_FULL_62_17]